MKAIRLIQPGKKLEEQNIPEPTIGPQDVLIRVRAAGICHSDAHYRAGRSTVSPLPLTLGHEVAGVVEKTGDSVSHVKPGDRVCVHYMTTCGRCEYCQRGSEQFCTSGLMVGKYRDGGFAEYLAVPGRSVFHLPEEIPFEHGAVMMCSSSTSFHALRKARLKPGETVAVFGVGGLGISAVQLALASGALKVFAVDIKPNKLELAAHYGAIPVDARINDPVAEIRSLNNGRGVDVALELIGLQNTMHQAFLSLGVFGRAVIAGISNRPLVVDTYNELINREAEIIGASDHLASELVELIEWTRLGKLDFSHTITRSIPLDAAGINETLDRLEHFSEEVRVVVTP
jgi:propanol-preferring alcohol dehydrogenase